MHIKKMISTIDTHTAGEPTRIVTAGIPNIKGKSMMEKKIWLQENLDNVRKILMLEPRGHKDMFGAILTEPVSDDADFGVIFMESKGYLDMCGHGSIGAVTALLETGMIPIEEDKDKTGTDNTANQENRGTINKINSSMNSHIIQNIKETENRYSRKVIFDTPAGKVTAYAEIENSVVTDIRICNVPAFYYDSVSIELPSIGNINVDISYGGNFFALVNAKELNVELKIENVDQLISIGIDIIKQLGGIITVTHPVSGETTKVGLVEIYQDGLPCKNVVVFGNRQFDRSPCGTGTCAKMAYLYEKGKLGIGEPYPHSSIINTLFTGKIIKETMAGTKRAVIPEITGRAYITGFHNFVVYEDDPFKEGFTVSKL